jgi:hypothetical protein
MCLTLACCFCLAGEEMLAAYIPPVTPHIHPVMSQADIDAFVWAAKIGPLTPEGVTRAVASGIPVNGRHSSDSWTALHWAVFLKRRDLVVALLAAGADANVTDNYG